MLSSNVIISIGIIFLAVVFYNLYNSLMKSDKKTEGGNLQITPEEIFEQVEDLVEKGNVEIANQLAKNYLNENPSHDRLRLILAKSLYKVGKYFDSIPHFEKLLVTFPDRDDLLELLAISYRKVGQRTNAINSYLELLKLAPGSIDTKFSLAELYDETQQKKLSLDLYNKLLEELSSENDKVQCLLRMARISRDMSQMDDAVDYANRVLEFRPESQQALNFLKEIYKTMGRDSDLIDVMTKLLAQNPDNAVMKWELVNFYYNNCQYEEALNLAQGALNVAGIDKIALNLIIAKIYNETDRLDEAAEVLQSVLALHPKNIDVMGLLANIYLKTGKYENAIELYHNLTDLSGIDEAKIHRNRLCNLFCDWAMHFFNNGDIALAFEKLNLALEINPENISIYKNLGKIAFVSKDYNEAIKQFQRAIDIDPNDSESYVLLGDIYCELDDTYNAEKAYQEAIYLSPNNAPARCKLGVIRIKQRNVSNALEHLKIAVEQDAENPDYLYNLALGYEFASDVENALKTYERVLQINPEHCAAINNMKILKDSN